MLDGASVGRVGADGGHGLGGSGQHGEAHEECHGVDLSGTDEYVGKVDFKYVIDAYKKLGCGDDFFLKNGFFDLLTGQRSVKETIIQRAAQDASVEEIANELKASWQEDLAAFKALRKNYLLYKDFE